MFMFMIYSGFHLIRLVVIELSIIIGYEALASIQDNSPLYFIMTVLAVIIILGA